MKSPHPILDEILDATEGLEVSDAVAAHLVSCESCRAVAAGTRRVLSAMAEARGLPAVPDAVYDSAMTRIRDALNGRRRTAGATGFLRGLVAWLGEAVELTIGTLVADSMQPSAATRAGGEITAAPRMLLYETPDYDIVLSLGPGTAPGLVEITGQVTPRTGELPPHSVAGVRVGQHTATSALSRFGEFGFQSVPSGELEVEIGIDASIIRLSPIPRHEV